MSHKSETHPILMTSIRSVYQLQTLRIQMGNRLVASFRDKYMEVFNVKIDIDTLDREEKDKLYQKILGYIKEEYNRITDAIVEDLTSRHKEAFSKEDELSRGAKLKLDKEDVYKESKLITRRAEYSLVSSYIRTLRTEEHQFKDIEKLLADFPIYTEFLKNVKGVGPAMAGVIIAYVDIHKAIYPTNILAYMGIDVGPDGRGRGMYKEHLVDREYTDKKGKPEIRKSITFEPFLKSKMVGVLGPSFLRTGSPYRNAYDGYKHRLMSRPLKDGEEPLSKLHIHRRAIRYMLKMFVIDLYTVWRKLEGLEVSVPYEQAKLGIEPHHQGKVNDVSRGAYYPQSPEA